MTKRPQVRGPRAHCPSGCGRLTDGIHRHCDVCRGKTSGLGAAGKTGRKPKQPGKRCWECEGMPWRREPAGCRVCGEPYAQELSLDGTEKRSARLAPR